MIVDEAHFIRRLRESQRPNLAIEALRRAIEREVRSAHPHNAFYTAVAQNQSAKELLGDAVLGQIAKELVRELQADPYLRRGPDVAAHPDHAKHEGTLALQSQRQSTARHPLTTEGRLSDTVAPIDVVAQEIASRGATSRPLRQAVALLTEHFHTLDEMVRDAMLPRRTVAELLEALGDDLEHESGRFRIRPEKTEAYRTRFDCAQLSDTQLTDHLAQRTRDEPELLKAAESLISAAPKPARALDHVSATPETVVRRALWLDSQYDLAGAHLLCLGDHDLTSLTLAKVNPSVAVTVVDIDERILRYIDEVARSQDLNIRCFFADFRFGLPSEVQGRADVVFTDPPYTSEGVTLFLARGLESIRDREHGRLVMAYGFSDHHPILGLQVQQSVQRLGLAFEAILPHFNRYIGAQAIGSASDLYVCRPTSKTWKALDSVRDSLSTNIYTHGPQASEAGQLWADEQALSAVEEAAAGKDGLPVTLLVTGGKARPESAVKLKIDTLFASGVPAQFSRQPDLAVAMDLSPDPGPWLLRALLATNATRLAMLVPNNHPDLANQEAQREVSAIVGPKYSLKFIRNAPDSRHAIVWARAVVPGQDPAAMLANIILGRAHGKLTNVWREGLVRVSERLSGYPITKNDARSIVQAAARGGYSLDASLITMPRHQIQQLLIDVEESAKHLRSLGR